ncbi:c-type cytochrome biogenesis protein CcmI [Sandarakinorhabdus rubra]|uniref:c-type cytochrome biogenesis protein CcmI n=1 Tax=Sandarakinorhabdus rubra TaxID=2672568 RepID=UPI0013DB1764|nr:c-type cytochrome biogenesis protein CcmI [Sandarakinorhabdus rubra]
MTLWIILIALSAMAAAWLTIPLVRRHEARVDARAATIAVLKDQLADIDVQLAAGSIQPPEAEGMRNEIRRRLLAAGHIPPELDRTMGQKALSGVALGLAGLVAVAAAALYASMGRPDLASGAGAPSQAAVAAPQEQAASGEVAQLIAGLEQKMQATPDDPEGWRMLGWSYFQTGRYADAVRAYGRAIALKPDGEGFQSAYGEALVQEAGGQVTPAAAAAFEKAAAQDGADARARYFLAVRKAETGDRKGAIDDWLRLLADSPADAPWLPQLKGIIEQTAQAAGIDIATRLAATKPVGNAAVPGLPPPVAAAAAAGSAGPPAGVMPGPSRDQVQAAQAMDPAQRQAMIRGMVDGLAERLKANPKDEAGWLRLMRARSVLGEAAAAKAARDSALAAFAGDPAAQGRIRAAAAEMGL